MSPTSAESRIAVRLATSADVAALCDVCVRSIRARCTPDYTPEQLDYLLSEKTPEVFADWISRPETRFLAGLMDGEIAGVAMVHDAGWLGLLYTTPETAGLGLGKRLLAAAEDEARAMGLHVLNTKSTLTSWRFYESQGYINMGMSDDGRTETFVMPAYWMVKRL